MKKKKIKIIVTFVLVLVMLAVITSIILFRKHEESKKVYDFEITFETNGGTPDIEASTNVNVNDIDGTGITKLEYIWDTQNETIPIDGWIEFVNSSEIKNTETGIYYLWIRVTDNNGNVKVDTSNVFEIGDVEKIVTTVQTENTNFAGNIDEFSYNNPVIPAGFVAVDTKEASWENKEEDFNNGLVIQDENANQFVWVPVDRENVEYKKNLNYPSWCDTPPSATIDDSLTNGVKKEIDQINKYHGFYIARYEAGKDNDNLVIKKDADVWNNISYLDAKEKANNMYQNENVKSGLVTGAMWDTTMKWIENSGVNVSSDSRTWGNYASNIIAKTGSSKDYRIKNIYDLAGNTFEWNLEKNNKDYVYRGGSYGTSGVYNPASFRHSYTGATLASSEISFRVVLYVN